MTNTKSPSRIALHISQLLKSDPTAAALIKREIDVNDLIRLLDIESEIDDIYGIPSTATLDDAFDQGYRQGKIDYTGGE